MQRLWDAGIEHVAAGSTSTAELLRVLELPLPPTTAALLRAANADLHGPSLPADRARTASRAWVRESAHRPDADAALSSLDNIELIDPG
jgi:hypothetical protein